MARLVDLYCPDCGQVCEDQWLAGQPGLCPECGEQLQVLCNGGTGRRFHFNDFWPAHDRRWEGHCRYLGASVHAGSDDGPAPVCARDKSPILLDQGKSDARMDRRRWERRARCGQNPQHFDARKR